MLIHKTVHVVESSLTSKAMERLLQAKRRLFLGNLFIAFIVKNINLGIIGEFFFGMDEKLHSLIFLIFKEILFEVSQLIYKQMKFCIYCKFQCL